MVQDIASADGGWSYAGLLLHRVPEDSAEKTGDREAIPAIVKGEACLTGAGRDWGLPGGRMDVLEKTPPQCLVLPDGRDWPAGAATDCIIAICTASGRSGQDARHRLGGHHPDRAGARTPTRHIDAIAMKAKDYAGSFLGSGSRSVQICREAVLWPCDLIAFGQEAVGGGQERIER